METDEVTTTNEPGGVTENDTIPESQLQTENHTTLNHSIKLKGGKKQEKQQKHLCMNHSMKLKTNKQKTKNTTV